MKIFEIFQRRADDPGHNYHFIVDEEGLPEKTGGTIAAFMGEMVNHSDSGSLEITFNERLDSLRIDWRDIPGKTKETPKKPKFGWMRIYGD